MSSPQEIRALLESYAAAWSRGDSKALVALYADDIVFDYLGHHALSGRHVGKSQALAALAEFNRRTKRKLKAVTDVLVGEESGALIVRETMGPEAREVGRILDYTVSDGLLRSCVIYDSDQSYIDRLVGE